jgi:CspA family cold shock protein
MKGKIKFFNSIKGFGFIVGEDKKEVFFHHTGLDESVTKAKLSEGTEVTFDTEDGKKGTIAVDIQLA